MTALIPFLALIGLLLVVVAPYAITGWFRDRRARIIAGQIELTDAIHAELGAAASPFVTKPAFGPWRVTYTMPSGRTPIDRLIAITHSVLRRRGAADIEIVFTPSRSPRLRAA